MAASVGRASPGDHKLLLTALLCFAVAASFLPGSSGSTSLVADTCGRTSKRRLCVSLLQSSNQSRRATTVQQLAIVAVTAARRSVLRARLRALDLSYGAAGTTPVGHLVARCSALYADCLRAAGLALGRVTFMPGYDERAADAVTALRVFPEKCARLFDQRKIASPLQKVNRDTEEKLGIASEIVRLLR